MTHRPPVAIVGIGGLFPDSPDLETFWKNVRDGVDTSREAPAGRWTLPASQAYDPERGAPDKVYSTRACFIDDIELDLDGLDIDPEQCAELDPMVQIALHAGAAAWRDAKTATLDRTRVGVILGNIALPTESTSQMADAILGQSYAQSLFAEESQPLPDDPVAAPSHINRYVTGLPAGVLARALGLGAGHFTLDAACASSLFALKHAVDELQAGRADAMLSGGLSRPDCLYTQMGFSQLSALSPSGHCSPFDDKGDGLVVGEGAGIVVLKRLDDAIEDGDEIHAVIRGIGLSNDVDGNLLAPSVEGQVRAMRAAYQQAGWQPSSVDLIECHATGTPVGDAVELNSLRSLWEGETFEPGQCTIGSVKSNVGHLLTGAGAAGLVKVLLAMREETLPPTANFETAGAGIQLENSPFAVRSTAAPWPNRGGQPRRAAVSGFGFGGTNAHVLLEQWTGDYIPPINIDVEEPDSIVIVGMAARCGNLANLAAVQHRLLGNQLEIPPATKQNFFGQANPPKGWFLEEIRLRAGRFRIPPTEIAETLPQQLLMLDVAEQALRDAKVEQLDRLRTGVFIGIGLDLNTTNYHLRWALRSRAAQYAAALSRETSGPDFDVWVDRLCDGLGPALNANRVMGNLGGIVASRVAREFGMGGPSYVLSTEESSGLTALAAAVRGLQLEELSCALVGAVDLPSDVRAMLATDADRPYSPLSEIRPFDSEADGSVAGDGAACVILKRRRDAERDGDRIYATLSGIGATTGGKATALLPSRDAYQRALKDAYQQAGVEPDSVGYIEAHGSGQRAEDQLEAEVLSRYFQAPVLGSSKSDIGHTGAASGLFGLLKAVLGLHHRVLPPLRGLRDRNPALGALLTPHQAQYWLHDQGVPRRAGVSSMSVTGSCYHLVVEEEQAKRVSFEHYDARPLGPRHEHLFVVTGDDIPALQARVQELSDRAADQDAGSLANQWWQQHGNDPAAKLALAVVCQDSSQLQQLCTTAVSALPDPEQHLSTISRQRLFFSRQPLGRSGQVAFIYPGSGSHYHGMGRELAVQWPQVVRQQERQCRQLRSQLVPELIWNAATESLSNEPQRLILAQVALGTLVTDIIQSHGVIPDAVIGYSLGETAGLFSLGAWQDRDEMLRRVHDTDLFTQQLTGPCLAARDIWGLPDNEDVDWMLGVVDQPSTIVDKALRSYPRAYRLIINTPDECVIGGQRSQVEAALRDMGAGFHELHSVTTVHCEVTRSVKQAYHALHILPTDITVPARFYSGEAGKSYELAQETAAASVTNQALFGIDYPKVIRQAFEDGVRIFLEMGPGASCTRMIGKILEDEHIVTRSVCSRGRDGVSSVLQTLAMLVSERVSLDLTSLYETPGKPVPLQPSVGVMVGGKAFQLPKLTTPAPTPRPSIPPATAPVQDTSQAATPTQASQALAGQHPSNKALPNGPTQALVAATAESAAAHETYLRLAEQTTALLTQQIEAQFQLIQQLQVAPGGIEPIDLEPISIAAPAIPHADHALPLFDRDMCMQIAIGSIAKVLGPRFAAIDTHPTRVRLPDEPLMLVDRILSIDGEPLSMTTGKIVTEHDVLAGKWYLDNGRIPTCIAVEAGQADLFLSGYLGIDFETKGLAVYRLLDAVVTFHDQLPGIGKTIHYEIELKEFFRQGDTWLFRFEFEATVDGQPLITMKEGCAGFFTQQELDSGKGIVESKMERQIRRGVLPADFRELAPMKVESLDGTQVEALRKGDLVAAFGQQFAGLHLKQPLTLPTGAMELVHRVQEINPTGGRYGIGSITAEADIHPEDWFLTCHFSDDMVMPGTLMYECCLHTLRLYLLRMGWVAEAADVVYQPILGVRSRLKCRGQVLSTTKLVTYEVSIKELGYAPEPYAIVDSLMYADGKPIVEINDMSVRMTGVNREYFESLWDHRASSSPSHTTLYDYDQILAFSNGKPSEAFGPPYQIFDSERKIARLPRPPFQFLDRITSVSGEPFAMKAGATCRAEVDISPAQWFFASNRQSEIPFSVLLEIALQPCGWLAAYVGSALTSDDDLKFRNLGGQAVQHAPVCAETNTLITEVEMTSVSSSGGMIIQHYTYKMTDRSGSLIYEGTTYFGFFSHQALAEQIGIRDADVYEPDAEEQKRAESFPICRTAPFADDKMRMVDDIDLYIADGGPTGLGFVRGTIDVDPAMWFFDAHFYEDPVWPGSLGLEAFLQILKAAAARRWGLGATSRFATMPRDASHRWIYRGQVIPSDSRVTVQACIQSVDDDAHTLVADGFLSVDGRIIYQMQEFALQVLP